MSFLLRKINRPKWEPNGELSNDVDSLQADVVSQCLTTKGNTLSVWITTSNDWDSEEVKEILGALFSTMDGPNRTDVLFIEQDKVGAEGISILNTIGQTAAIDKINEKHRDLAELNWSSVKDVANLILNELKDVKIREKENSALKRSGKTSDEFVQAKRFSEKSVKNIVKEQTNLGNIQSDKLCERWLKHLGLLTT